MVGRLDSKYERLQVIRVSSLLLHNQKSVCAWKQNRLSCLMKSLKSFNLHVFGNCFYPAQFMVGNKQLQYWLFLLSMSFVCVSCEVVQKYVVMSPIVFRIQDKVQKPSNYDSKQSSCEISHVNYLGDARRSLFPLVAYSPKFTSPVEDKIIPLH